MGILHQKSQTEKEIQQDFKDFINKKENKTKKKPQPAIQPKEELVCEPC